MEQDTLSASTRIARELMEVKSTIGRSSLLSASGETARSHNTLGSGAVRDALVAIGGMQVTGPPGG